MKLLIIPFILCFSIFVKAQEQQDVEVDSVYADEPKLVQLYIAPVYNISSFAETGASFAGVYLGVNIHDRVDLSLSFSKILNDFKKQIIFPTIYFYDQINYGFHVDYTILKSKISPLVGLGFQYVDASWESDNDIKEVFQDYFFLYNVFVGAKWNINKTFDFQVNVGYNYLNNVSIVGLESYDFNGIYGDLILKIRIVNFEK